MNRRSRGIGSGLVLATGLAFTIAACNDKPPAPSSPGSPPTPKAMPSASTSPAAQPQSMSTARPSTPATGTPDAAKGSRIDIAGFSIEVPADWTRVTQERQMRVAEFTWPPQGAGEETTSLIVFYFGPGGGGGVQANLNRWRGQFVEEGKPSLGETSEVTIGDVKITLFEKSGVHKLAPTPMSSEFTPKPGWRMIAAIVEIEGGPYFFRAVGPDATVAAQKVAFVQALRSIQPRPK